MSKKTLASTIQEITDQVVANHFDGNMEMTASVKNALVYEAEQAGDEDGLVLESVVDRAFGSNNEAKDAFIALSKEYGLPHQVMLDKPFVQREFKIQRYKADNGVELKLPAGLFQDPDQLQLQTNPDGSINVTLKNLRPAEL